MEYTREDKIEILKSAGAFGLVLLVAFVMMIVW